MNFDIAYYTTITFPSLGISVNPPRMFTIGPLNIYIYGILIALGLGLAVLYACKRTTEFGIKEDDILDGVLWITPLAIVCARLYYCIFSWADYAENPISILYIWEGGLAIYGGVIGAIIGVIILCRYKKIKLPALLDLVALGFLIGQSLGRWGNFFNREAFGAATESFLRMGLFNIFTFQTEYYHPTFLYESVWNLVGFIVLHKLASKRQYDGQIALGYVFWYGLGRTIIEGLRTDSLYLGWFRVSQVIAAISCLVAAWVLMKNMLREHDPKNLFVNQVAAAAEEKPAVEAAEEAAAEAEETAEADEETKEETAEEVTEEATEEATEESAEEAAEEATEETKEAE